MKIKRQESPRTSQEAKVDSFIEIFAFCGHEDTKFRNYILVLATHKHWLKDVMFDGSNVALCFENKKSAQAALSVLTDDEGNHAGDEMSWLKFQDGSWWLTITWVE